MIQSITISNVGPHAATTLNLSALTTITGASGAGKSTLIDALGAALGIGDRDGSWLASVTTADSSITVRLDSGHRIHWTPASTQIAAPCDKKGTRYATQKALLPALVALGVLPTAPTTLLRLAFLPGEWLRLAEGSPTDARTLRATLAPVLGDPTAALREALTDAGLSTWTGPTEPKAIDAALSGARATAERAKGAIEAHTATLSAAAFPDPGAAPAATLSAIDRAWDRYDSAAADVAHWEAAEIPDAPAIPSAALSVTLTTLQAAASDWAAYRTALAAQYVADARDAEIATWDTARATLGACPHVPDLPAYARALSAIDADIEANHAAAETGHLCPECSQPLPEEALDAASAKNLAARAALNVERQYAAETRPALVEEWDAANKAANKWRSDVAALGQRPTALRRPAAVTEPTTLEPTQADLAAASEVVTAAQRAEAARAAALRARGQRPADPVAPTDPRPTQAALAAEARAIAAHSEAVTIFGAAVRARIAAERALAEAQARLEAAEKSVADLLAVREAVRSVPDRLARSAEWLTNIAEIVALTEAGVTIMGRNSRRRSTGERVFADAVFRSALLARLGGAMPLIVDGAQDWSDYLPDHPGQMIVLRTAPGAITVT